MNTQTINGTEVTFEYLRQLLGIGEIREVTVDAERETVFFHTDPPAAKTPAGAP